MKAVRIHNYGTTEALKIEEVPLPTISNNEILVKVHAASVNHIDGLKASGIIKHIYPLQFPWIPGADFAGTVESIGNDVTEFTPGDAVYGSKTEGGAYAEFIVVTPDSISYKPKTLSFVEAASVPMVAETALKGLFHHAQLRSGQSILIHGGAGAVGGYAVQLAHQAGATVIVTASHSDKDYLLTLGADEIIDYKTGKFETAVTNVDVVFDLVGGEVQQKSFAVIKQGGCLIAVNQPPSQDEAKKRNITAVFMHAKPSTDSLTHIANLLDGGKLKIDVAEEYTLEDVRLAWGNNAANLGDKIRSHTVRVNKKHGKHVLRIR